MSTTPHVVPIINLFGQLTAFVASSRPALVGSASSSRRLDGGSDENRPAAVPFDLNACFLMVEDHFPVGFPEGEV